MNNEELDSMIQTFKTVVSSLKIKKIPLVMNTDDDIVLFSRNIQENIIPTFLVSNLDWKGLSLFKNFLSMLPTNHSLINHNEIEKETFQVNNNYILF